MFVPCIYAKQITFGRGHETRLSVGCTNEKILFDKDGGDFSDRKLETNILSCLLCSEYSPATHTEQENELETEQMNDESNKE